MKMSENTSENEAKQLLVLWFIARLEYANTSHYYMTSNVFVLVSSHQLTFFHIYTS